MPQPLPLEFNQVLISLNFKQFYQREYIQKREQLESKIIRPQSIGRKLIVSEDQLDNWFAKQFNLDIQNIPSYRPSNMNKQVYDYLKKYAPHNQNEDFKNSVIAQRLKQRQSRISIKDQQKSTKVKKAQSAQKKPTLQEIGSRESGGSSMNNQRKSLMNFQSSLYIPTSKGQTAQLLQNFQPIMYEKTKKVTSFIDTLPEYIEEEQNTNFRFLRHKRRSTKNLNNQGEEENESQTPKQQIQKKREMVVQENFKLHNKPSISVLNRMNQNIGTDLMSRGEIQKSAEKMIDFGSIKFIRQSQEKLNNQYFTNQNILGSRLNLNISTSSNKSTNTSKIIKIEFLILSIEKRRNSNREKLTLQDIENELKEAENPDFEQCKLNVKQIPPVGKIAVKEVFQDSEYWHHKGFSYFNQVDIEVSIDYYLHGIRSNPRHYACMFNVACVYQQLNKHLNAIKWFKYSIQIKLGCVDSYYGCAISMFKLKLFQEGLEIIEAIPRENPEIAVKKLSKLPFFSRIKENKLKKIMKKLKLIEVQKDEVVFCEDKISILINGRLIMRHHEKSVYEHKIIGNLIPGQIIGFEKGDQGVSKDCNISNICASQFAQLIEVDINTFEKLWRYSQENEVETLVSILNTFQLLQIIFPQNLQSIAYDNCKHLIFEAGQLVLEMHSRSILNNKWKLLYDNTNSTKLQQEIAKNLINSQQEDSDNLIAPSVYQGYMRALSRKKTDKALIKTLSSNVSYNPSVKKSILGSFSKNIKNFMKESPQKNTISVLSTLTNRVGNVIKSSLESSTALKDQLYQKLEMRPLFIILSGYCQVICPIDNYEVVKLKRGEVFGESDLLRLPSYDFFGNIITGSEGCECLMIENPNELLTLYERQRMKTFLQDKMDGLKHLLETRYKLKPLQLSQY
eukprot:403352393